MYTSKQCILHSPETSWERQQFSTHILRTLFPTHIQKKGRSHYGRRMTQTDDPQKRQKKQHLNVTSIHFLASNDKTTNTPP